MNFCMLALSGMIQIRERYCVKRSFVFDSPHERAKLYEIKTVDCSGKSRCLVNISKVGCRFQCVFNLLSRFLTSFSKSFWCKIQEPVVIKINGLFDIFFPEMRLISIYRHNRIQYLLLSLDLVNPIGAPEMCQWFIL